MRILMKTLAAGALWRGEIGQIVDRPAAEAKALIDGGYAVAEPGPTSLTAPADAPKEPEAVEPPVLEEVEIDDRADHEKAGDEAFEAAIALGMSKEEAAKEAVAASAKFPDSPYFKAASPTAPADAPKEPVNGSEAGDAPGDGASDDGRGQGASPG